MIITIILIAIAAIAVLILIALHRFKNAPMATNHEKIIVLTDQNFNQTIQNKLILIDFWAAWCMPCKMIAPILNELADELPENCYIGKMDIETYKFTAQKMNVRNIPTLIIFKNGKEVERIVGVKPKNFIKQQILKHT